MKRYPAQTPRKPYSTVDLTTNPALLTQIYAGDRESLARSFGNFQGEKLGKWLFKRLE